MHDYQRPPTLHSYGLRAELELALSNGQFKLQPENGFLTLSFSTSWNNDQTPEAMGKYLQDQGINDLYVMAPNYQAGKDMVAGLKRYYKGNIVDEVYTKMGQLDYQAELTQLRSKNPKAVFIFWWASRNLFPHTTRTSGTSGAAVPMLMAVCARAPKAV